MKGKSHFIFHLQSENTTENILYKIISYHTHKTKIFKSPKIDPPYMETRPIRPSCWSSALMYGKVLLNSCLIAAEHHSTLV